MENFKEKSKIYNIYFNSLFWRRQSNGHWANTRLIVRFIEHDLYNSQLCDFNNLYLLSKLSINK